MASAAQAKEFIQKIAPLIQTEALAREYKVCSPIIAQACIESAYDSSVLAYKYHNYFGMKCGNSWRGRSVNLRTKEEVNSTLVSIRDNFRVYATMEQGVSGYFDFISTKRYANLKDADTPEEYLKRIKADGYATSSSYVNTNMNCIWKWDLEEWDSVFRTQLLSLDEIAFEVISGKWGTGATRKQRLRAAGYNPSIVQARVNEILKK